MSIELNAELRTDLGKGASRRLRHAEKMPAILYGAGKDPVGLTLLQKDVRAHQDNEVFYSSIISLKVDGKAEKVIIRDVQHHPYKVDLFHIDFQRTMPNPSCTFMYRCISSVKIKHRRLNAGWPGQSSGG